MAPKSFLSSSVLMASGLILNSARPPVVLRMRSQGAGVQPGHGHFHHRGEGISQEWHKIYPFSGNAIRCSSQNLLILAHSNRSTYPASPRIFHKLLWQGKINAAHRSIFDEGPQTVPKNATKSNRLRAAGRHGVVRANWSTFAAAADPPRKGRAGDLTYWGVTETGCLDAMVTGPTSCSTPDARRTRPTLTSRRVHEGPRSKRISSTTGANCFSGMGQIFINRHLDCRPPRAGVETRSSRPG